MCGVAWRTGSLHGGDAYCVDRRRAGAPGGTVAAAMRVWIDQDLCTGDGLCVDHCPDVFVQLEDGIAYVAEAGVALNDPGGSGSLAWVPERHTAGRHPRRRGVPGRVHLHLERRRASRGRLARRSAA